MSAMADTLLAPHSSPSLPTSQFYFEKGRVALYALLRALQVGPSDEIVVPVYTCPAVIEPVVGLGARAVYCDIERTNFGLSPRALETALTAKTKAVVVQHTFGVPAGLDQLMNVTRERGVAILEDCCHVSSSFYRRQRLGSFGDAAFYSHDWDKPFSAGGGGRAVVNSMSLAEQVERGYREFSRASIREEARIVSRNTLVRAKRMARARLPGLVSRLRPYTPAVNGDRWPALNGGLGPEYARRISKSSGHHLHKVLKNSSLRISARKRAIDRYESGFRSIGIDCFETPEHCEVVLWRYPLRTFDKARLLEEAGRYGASLADWGSIPLRFLSAGGLRQGSFPVAEATARALVTVMIREQQDDGEVDRTLQFLCSMKQRGLL
jgi:perosamine synthetase